MWAMGILMSLSVTTDTTCHCRDCRVDCGLAPILGNAIQDEFDEQALHSREEIMLVHRESSFVSKLAKSSPTSIVLVIGISTCRSEEEFSSLVWKVLHLSVSPDKSHAANPSLIPLCSGWFGLSYCKPFRIRTCIAAAIWTRLGYHMALVQMGAITTHYCFSRLIFCRTFGIKEKEGWCNKTRVGLTNWLKCLLPLPPGVVYSQAPVAELAWYLSQ